jgi:hypothetical protein
MTFNETAAYLAATAPSFGAPPSGRSLARNHAVGNDRAGITTGGFVGPFEALRDSPDRTPINAPSVSRLRMAGGPVGWGYLETTRREQLAALGRYIVDNYGGAAYAVGMIADYSGPIIPRGATDDPAWNRAIDDLFDLWAERADFFGRFDFSEIQRVALFALNTDGDIGFSMDDSGGDGPRLRAWPCWRVASKLENLMAWDEVDGVRIDGNGVVTGYNVVSGMQNDSWRRFNTEEFALLYEAQRMDRYRGMPPVRAGLNDLRDAHDIKGMVKLGTKIRSAFAAVVEGSLGDPDEWEDPESESPAASVSGAPKSITMAQLFGGEIPQIDGQLKQVTGVGPASNELEFMDALAGHFVMGLGLPPAFFLDSKLTGPNQRAVIVKAQKRFNAYKRIMTRLAGWTWVRFVAWAVSTGQIASHPQMIRRRYQGPPEFGIDLGDQANADREAVKAGLKSRARYHGAAGCEWRDEEDGLFSEDEYILTRCKEQATRLGVPLDVILARHGYIAEKPQPAQAPQNTQNQQASQ